MQKLKKLKKLAPRYEIVKKGKIQFGDIIFDKRIEDWLSPVTEATKSINGEKVLGDSVCLYYGVARKMHKMIDKKV